MNAERITGKKIIAKDPYIDPFIDLKLLYIGKDGHDYYSFERLIEGNRIFSEIMARQNIGAATIYWGRWTYLEQRQPYSMLIR
ncbi:MAG: hypothetical protein V1808_04465 [Candidatus Daviesbacteria bacterium]